MAYFSNGTEGMHYESRYCDRCVNYRESPSGSRVCPIWDLHHDYNYDQLNKGKTAKAIRAILNELIPETEKGFAGECSMFLLDTSPPSVARYIQKLREAEEPVFGEWQG